MSELTARANAYSLLKEAILDGTFKPGDHLREEHLARDYNVSRTPIRQAIRQLANEGLIEIGGNKRSHVTNVDGRQLEQMFDVQAMMESYSAGLAAECITEADLDNIRTIQAELEADYFSGDAQDDRSYLYHNARFHNAIHRCNGNPRLYEMVENLVEIPAAMFIKLGRLTNSEVSIDYHRRIIQALEMRDSKLTRLIMRTHIETVRREYRNLMLQQVESQDNDPE